MMSRADRLVDLHADQHAVQQLLDDERRSYLEAVTELIGEAGEENLRVVVAL